MNNKVYELLPGHLRNKNLEGYFEATLERAFSKGSVDKTRGYVGRKEKGIYKVNQPYITYPTTSIDRENYSFEPVYSNTSIGDNVFYDDLLNALYNKGALTNDHRRLFTSEIEALNIPINKDKFINFELYYWVETAFADTVNGVDMTSLYTDEVSYVVMARGETNWWSLHNGWFHYDDINELITTDNQQYIHQAKRPIIEFDSRLELSDTSATKDVTSYDFSEPTFKSYDVNSYETDVKVFSYVTGTETDYPYDEHLQMYPKLIAGDYISEFAFVCDLPENSYVNLSDGGTLTPYIDSTFDYRNFREEFTTDEVKSVFELKETPKSGAIDVYVDGIKQLNNYTVSGNTVTLGSETTDFVYIDYCVDGNVTTNAKGAFQRVNPTVEYNPDGLSYISVELTFSNVFEHFVRIIETTDGITGEAISNNNYRDLKPYADNIIHNDKGSVLIRSKKDIADGYFAITRDDYDPILAVDFLATAYANFKSRFVNEVRTILNGVSDDRSNTDILEEAINNIARTRNSVVRVFEGSEMIQIGTLYNHYEEQTVQNVVGSYEQFMPSFDNSVAFDRNVEVYFNGELKRLGVDYTITPTGGEIIFTELVQASDEIVVRHYFKSEDSKIPPSATYLGIHPSFIPQIITDTEYGAPIDFIVGHDGSKTPVWGDRTDDILLELEVKMYNYLETKNVSDVYMDDAVFWNSTNGYSNNEKNYIMKPLFNKWARRNDAPSLLNEDFDIADWKTWNYKPVIDVLPGNWRGIHEYFYGTDQVLIEPWRILQVSVKPEDFDATYGSDYTSVAFWQNLIAATGMTVPVPVTVSGELKTIEELLGVTLSDINDLNVDWEFGDRSPVEMAWRRSSDYAFNTFAHRFLQKPFDIASDFKDVIEKMVRYFAKRDSFNVDTVLSEKSGYQFKLGSKLAGFVNNFNLLSENTSLSNSRFTDIPKDNYDLFVHVGEANRSENLSGIVIEKVSIDNQYPTYDIINTASYKVGDIVINPYDKQYYRRKVAGQTAKEQAASLNFDYAAWVLISQPKVATYGYRVYGYNDINPVFYTLEWDTTSGEKVYETTGDKMNIANWKSGTQYRVDQYVVYNGSPFVCIEDHQSTTLFSDNLTSWKALREWPRTNKVYAYGYNSVIPTSVKTYNYGDILYSKDEVAHLLVGYQEYLKQAGWDFTDLLDNATVDFEALLVKFLEWSVIKHDVGEYISLTPILETGTFSARMGTPSITRETYKNYFRVIDENGTKISDKDIEFFVSGNTINWKSTVPVYSITVDIIDVEHAFVVDREDSYGDTIYNPLTHDRNLRMIVDCNRGSDWNGTLEVDGYIVYDNKMIPNFETMAEETKYYRDTLVDQSLENLNLLKASHIGFTPRTYLSNMNMERESQLEFYKGFIVEKGSAQSINRLVNLESNIKDVKKSDVWALKLAEFGNELSRKTSSVSISNLYIKENPVKIDFNNTQYPFVKTDREIDAAVKTSGYVDYKNVQYVVQNIQSLESMDATNIYEGDIAWIQFDEDRDWDVRRLSEIAEIDFVGETSDGQLYVALTNLISTSTPVFLKIQNENIDPEIKGYYYLVFEEEVVIDGVTVYKYIVFETNYEPLIVEIDDLTSNSVYIPTPADSTVEAIGANANPEFVNGDTLFIDGVEYVYSSTAISSSAVTILGDENAVDPFVQRGETIRLVVYNTSGAVVNTNTTVEFDGTSAISNGTFSVDIGDQFIIEDTTITVAASNIQTITIQSGNPETTNVATGATFNIASSAENLSYVFTDIVVDGSVTNPVITDTKSISINNTVVTFTVPSPITGPNSVETFTNKATPVISVTLTTDMTYFVPGNITVDNGTDAPYVLGTQDYSYSSSTGVITFDTPIQDTSAVTVTTTTQTIVGDGIQDTFTLNDPSADRIIVSGMTEGVDYTLSGSNIVFTVAPSGNVNITFENDIPVADGFVDITVSLIAQPVPQSLNLTQIVSIINSSSAPVNAENISNHLRLTHNGAKLTMTGTALIDLGISTTSLFEHSKYDDLANAVNSLINFSSYVDGNGYFVMTTPLSEITISGTAGSYMGIANTTYTAVTQPTISSLVDQINAASIDGVTATIEGSKIIINRNASSLYMVDVTPGVLVNMGFADNEITIDSLQLIVNQINDSIFANTPTIGEASIENRRLKIVSPNRSISISNLVGNALSDVGIEAGTYVATQYDVTTALSFVNQINANVNNNGIAASISSDGRMTFKSNKTSMSFLGTTQDILDRIGLYREYSSVTSNEDFKIMRWKSVRYTKNVNGYSFDEFYQNLGLNAESYIWADDYETMGWAVLRRLTNGTLEVVRRKTDRIDTKLMNRLVVRDEGNNTFLYDIFDPVNGIFTGDLGKHLRYITWSDPAKYAHTSSKEKWLDDHVGKFWWDTSNARYFRYHDIGDANGNLDVSMARRYWGRLVEGSEIEVYRWSVDTVLPTDVTDYNEYTYFDTVKNKNVTKYYFWTKESVNQDANEYTPNDMKLLIEGAGNADRFIPISENSVLINVNNINRYVGNTYEFIVDYYVNHNKLKKHTEWHLLSEVDNTPVPTSYYEDMKKSLMDRNVVYETAMVIYEPVLRPSGDVKIEDYDVSQGLNVTNCVVTHNSKIIEPSNIEFNSTNIRISSEVGVIEGDVIRIYKLDAVENWFANITEARRTFAHVVNDYLRRQFLSGFASNWNEYIAKNDLIFSMRDWSIAPQFDTIEKYGYLSKTINFDMIALYNQGIKSFKIEETDYTAYYFELDGVLRMVRKSEESLKVSYAELAIPSYENILYYQNAIATQTYELLNMLTIFASDEFLKKLFVEMIRYLISEKTYPDWIFKTSYFDLVMNNDRLRQSAVYMRDSYQDMIDYINETKPYHAKIRETKNINTIDETTSMTASESHTFGINLHFGNVANYTFVADAAFVADPTITDIAGNFAISAYEGTYTVYREVTLGNGDVIWKELPKQYYDIVNGDLIFDAYNDILDGSVDDYIEINVGDRFMIQKNISRYNMNIVDGNSDVSYDNNLSGGSLLREIKDMTNLGGGIDTGFVSAFARDIMLVNQTDYTDDTRTVLTGKQFYVYDQFGRGYIVEVDKTGTINNFDGSTITVNQQSYFKSAKDDSVRLVILENSSKIEFMLYDQKDGTSLRVKNRGVYTGEMGDFDDGDIIYSVKTVRQI